MHSENSSGLLGDTARRDYATKLARFDAFAAPELRSAMDLLDLRPGMCVLDAGCGAGGMLPRLMTAVGPDGFVIGVDLAAAHVQLSRRAAPAGSLALQADLCRLPLAHGTFDAIWSANTIHHLRDPLAGLRELLLLLRPGGRLVILQGALLPEMYFAWDARLERKVTGAVRRYYQQRYGLDERDLAAVRNMLGHLQRCGAQGATARTLVIERIAPLSAADRDYLLDTIFANTWGPRLQPFLDAGDYAHLQRLCDPSSPEFALNRPDFHYLQTLTAFTAQRA